MITVKRGDKVIWRTHSGELREVYIVDGELNSEGRTRATDNADLSNMEYTTGYLYPRGEMQIPAFYWPKVSELTNLPT